MRITDRVFIAGHKGMVGSAIVRALVGKGYVNIITAEKQEVDLRNQKSVQAFFEQEKPDYVFLAAAKVGGIKANSLFPADFAYDNLMIQNNVIYNSYRCSIKKLIFLGSSCIYPKVCLQPIKEEYLMSGPLEPTNEAYAIAKIVGIKMAGYYKAQYGLNSICPVPCNLYGPNDSFDLDNSHVLSALVKKFTDAVDEKRKEIVLWGTGIAVREFMHVDDLARAILFLADKWDSPEIINVGSGETVTIKGLAELIAQRAGYDGKIVWDSTVPDGMLKKCLDIAKITALGFQPMITLKNGINSVIEEYKGLTKNKIKPGPGGVM
jgi:GDP-L-fucose synthase